MMMKSLVLAAMAGFCAWSTGARAAVDIRVNLTTQTMHVTAGNGESYDWPVSTARSGFVTPRGRYGVQSLQAMHYSRKYHNSPMPHSIFFKGGYAIHGTYETASLGAAASHGCVRLSPDHAAALYGMVRAEGAHISITGSPVRDDIRLADGRRTTRAARRRDEVRVASYRQRRENRGSASAPRDAEDEDALAYAPKERSYDDWMQNPFGLLGGTD